MTGARRYEIEPGLAIGPAGEMVRVLRPYNYCGSEGWAVAPENPDPGYLFSGYQHAPSFCLKPIIVGETVCRRMYGQCSCGLHHLLPRYIRELGLKTRFPSSLLSH